MAGGGGGGGGGRWSVEGEVKICDAVKCSIGTAKDHIHANTFCLNTLS